MADTTKDELLLGGGIRHVTVRRRITRIGVRLTAAKRLSIYHHCGLHIKRQWQTGYLPRPPTSLDLSQCLYAGWPTVCCSIYQVLLKSVQWFSRCEWPKLAVSHYFGHWLIQQHELPYKPWYIRTRSTCLLLHCSNALLLILFQLQRQNCWRRKMTSNLLSQVT